MKREILFRGYGILSNEWVEGDLIHGVGSKSGNIYILPNKVNLAYVKNCDPVDGVKVHPDSVGQFTGEMWYDVKIWENDKFDFIYGESGIVVFVDGAFMVKTTNNLYHLKKLMKEEAFIITGNTFQPQ